MKRILLLLMLTCALIPVVAQQKAPKWMEKQKKAIVNITTYKSDGSTLGTGVGFFITEDGKLLSSYSIFNGAQKAIVTDVKGKTYPVSMVLGADDMYDVIKLQVEVPKKVPFLKLVSAPLAVGDPVYLQPFTREKVKSFGVGKVEEVSKLKGDFKYYKLSCPLQASWVNAPVLNAEGEVFGLAQESASGKNEASFAVSANYVESLAINTSMDLLSSANTSVGIRKAWPAERDQAQVALYLMGNTQNAKTYLQTLNDFVDSFSDWSESYVRRASHYAFHYSELAAEGEDKTEYLKKADRDLEKAYEIAEKKAEVLYSKAQMMYSVAASDTTLNYSEWTKENAENILSEALKMDDNPIYHQLKGDMLFNQKNFEQAYQEYMIVNKSKSANATSWYMASKARQSMPAVQIGEVIQLLDSAIACYGGKVNPEMAPYILERIDWRMKLMQYKEAIADYDLYFKAVAGRVNDSYFYMREQAEFRMGDLEAALRDIRFALRVSPENPVYMAEEASIYVRQKKYDEALKCVEKALTVAPDFAACYRLRGVCYLRMEKKAEALEALKKAKELGDPLAERLINQNSK